MANAGVHRDGVFLLYKSAGPWKLGVATMGSSGVVEEYCDCARYAQIVSCGWGGVWIWKKPQQQKTYSLSYVDHMKVVYEYPDSFDGDAKIIGAQTQP